MMDPVEFYKVRQPSKLASPPERFSHSSLSRIKGCPRKFQLERSEFEGIGRFPGRPNPAAVEGTIVHESLEALFKAFARAGLPELGTPDAKQCVQDVDLNSRVAANIQRHNDRIKSHPRGLSFRIRSAPHLLVNQVIRVFRMQYASVDRGSKPQTPYPPSKTGSPSEEKNLQDLLQSKKALTEVPLKVESLGFEGHADLVYLDAGDCVIADFKTGKKKPEHELQAKRYALLWMRLTGQCPNRVELRYFSERCSFEVTKTELESVETVLQREIKDAQLALSQDPAKANIGKDCSFCDVRQFCTDYWSDEGEAQRQAGDFVDIEIEMLGRPTHTSFLARSSGGREMNIVFSPELGGTYFERIHPKARLRILDAAKQKTKNEFRLLPSAEVWYLPTSNQAT